MIRIIRNSETDELKAVEFYAPRIDGGELVERWALNKETCEFETHGPGDMRDMMNCIIELEGHINDHK